MPALDASGRRVATRRLRRSQVLDKFTRLGRSSNCVVGLEARGGSHDGAHELQRLGYRARCLQPQAVQPCRRARKTDAHDATAITEPR